MNIPLSWLKEYVDIKPPVQELAQRLTMAGVEVGGITTVGGWSNAYVGLVLDVQKHPNADRLTVCDVDLGFEKARVVCGAPNVAPGQKICFAKVGTVLFNTHTNKTEPLKAAKIRGVVSEGMICSARELGIGDDHEGIVVLDPAAPVGMPLTDYLGDYILDLEVTPNRVDCLAALGIAHECAALTGSSVHEPYRSYPESGEPIEKLARVEVLDPELCSRYTGSLVTGIKIAPSPRWLQDRLLKAGQRPINNVVDVTNYVMLEYGQPLHSFDYDKVTDHHIIVRAARPSETHVTLDGVERKLAPPMLVIADPRGAIGLAGIMGGANTEMDDRTTSVFLEAATFSPSNTRRTSQALKLRTEASLRFEKGLQPPLAEIALRRATKLIHELAGGTVAKGIIDVYPKRTDRAPMRLTAARIRKVLGAETPRERVVQVLTSLGFQAAPSGSGEWQVSIPYWRSDITVEDDLVEEVARITGYDTLPSTMMSTPVPQYQPAPLRELRERVRDILVSAGMQEVVTYSLVSEEMLKKAGATDGTRSLKLANPMTPEHEYARTTLRPSLLQALASNLRHEEGPMRLFELGRVYIPRPSDLPEERETLLAVLAGPDRPPYWRDTPRSLDFYDAKGLAAALLEALRVPHQFRAAEDPGFYPGRCLQVLAGGIALGVLGEAHPNLLDAFDVSARPVTMLQIDLASVLKALPAAASRYVSIPRFPAAVRDISLLADAEVTSAQIEEAIRSHRLVARAALFDVYSGEKLPPGKRSLAYHIYFQAPDRTLTAEEVNKAFQEIVAGLERRLGITLRS